MFVCNNNTAEEMDRCWEKKGEQDYKKIIAGIVNRYIQPESVVLDAGCKSGEVYKYLKPYLIDKNAYYIGIDGSIPFLDMCRKRYNDDCVDTEHNDWIHYKKVRFELQNLGGTVFVDDCFDTTICIDVLQHFPCYKTILKELFRITKDKLIFRTWVHDKVETINFKGGLYKNFYSKKELFAYCESITQGKVKCIENGLYLLSKTKTL